MTGAWNPALAGVAFTYSLTAQNLGPAAAGLVQITDTLPAGAVFSSASAGCTHVSGTVTCDLASLSSGASSAVSITVVPSGTSMTNGAVVAGDSVDANPANNSASVTTGVVAALPVSLAVDTLAGGGVGSDANGVFEPGEQVLVNPSWQNPSAGAAVFSGAATSFVPVSVAGGTYTIADATASYGSIGAGATGDSQGATGDSYELDVPVPGARPALHWDAQFTETLSTGAARTWTLHLGDSFTDVPRSHWAYRFVETIFHNGVTSGCGVAAYCPAQPLSRAEMAVLLLMAEHGPAYVPPASTGSVFTDVAVDHWAGDFIEALAAEGITAGCGGGRYCPDNPITRAEMAVFLLVAEHGPGWVPPAPTGTVFSDVPAGHWAGAYIETLAAEGITGGCGGGAFCPDSPVSRAEMAVFLTSTFGMELY
ncbi:MAG: S-layer homology domain-containing protein [Holophagales bacterium]|nr:S-layer homology domain-containing protein [Holophagales bacterium]